MPYTTNPHMPRLRARAVDMVREGKSIRQTARYFGFEPSTVSRWVRKVPSGGAFVIPTEPSIAKSHPHRIPREVQERIRSLRIALNGRCGEVIHDHLKDEGFRVGLRTVQRELDRMGMLKKRSKWKKQHLYPPRPNAQKPGDVVQIDTVHTIRKNGSRYYLYTLTDVCSRWSFAWATEKIGVTYSLRFLHMARKAAPFEFHCLQSDHGSEFRHMFTSRIRNTHRYSRIRRPNDNAHLERFNRTIQEEFLYRAPDTALGINKLLAVYLNYFNSHRKHLGLECRTPQQKLLECCEGSV